MLTLLLLLAACSPKEDPHDINSQLRTAIGNLKHLKGDFSEVDRSMEELLANPKYRVADSGIRAALEIDHRKIHEQARLVRLQKEADREVPPMLAQARSALANPEKVSKDLLSQICRIAGLYGMTSYGEVLDHTEEQLGWILFRRPPQAPGWQSEYIPLMREILSLEKESKFTEASRLIAEFGVRFHQNDDIELRTRLLEGEEMILRRALKYVDTLANHARDLARDGRGAEGLGLLREARSRVKGIGTAEHHLEEVITEFGR